MKPCASGRRCITRGVLIVFLVLLLLEASSLLFFPQSLGVPRERIGGALHLRPRATFTVEGVDFRNTVVTNSLGFHDREHPWEKRPGTRRILVLGDSMVEAVQVPVAQNLCALLEKDLGEGCEVINLGIAGAGQAHEYLALLSPGAKYAPDAVVLCLYAANDVYNNSSVLEAKKDKPFLVDRRGRLELVPGGALPEASPFVENPLWRLSSFYRFVVRRAMLTREALTLLDFDRRAVKPHLVFLKDPPLEWDDAWRVTGELLRRIDAAARGRGAKLLVALLPAKVQVLPAAAKAQLPRERGWDLERPHALAAAFCRERHIEYVDMLPDFRRLARAGTKLYFSKDEHLTREGHALAARLLAPRLRDLKGESPSPR